MWQRLHGTVFAKPVYISAAIFIAWAVFTLTVLLPNIQLISVVLFSDTASVIEKANFLFSLYGSIGTNFTFVSAVYAVMISVLFGVQIVLLTYYVRKVRGGVRNIKTAGATSIGGLVSGIFGIGCAACGTFILTSVLALFGATGLLTFLPWGGEEFGIIGVALLLYSIVLLVMKIDGPAVCDIE